ncbi:MAG: hypothetical protein RL757_3121 [Bacteroidota bacterium]
MKKYFWEITVLGLLVFGAACRQPNGGANRELAKVFDKTLYMSSLEDMFPENATRADSAAVVNAFIDRWTRDQLLLQTATRNVPSDVDIEKLVNDYRQSLILSVYEKKITEENLDSTVSETDLRNFYEANKAQYQIELPIVRAYLFKLPLPIESVDSVKKWWENVKSVNNQEKLRDYATKHHIKTFLLADSLWYRSEDVATVLGLDSFSPEKVSSGQEISTKDERFQYFLKVTATKNKGEIKPFDLVRDAIVKFILHERKSKLLQQKKQDLYDSELKRGNVKIYGF